MPDVRPTETVGVVLGSKDATPLEFWVGVAADHVVQLDDLIVVEGIAEGATVRYYGVVDQVMKRFEGQSYDSDAFRSAEGTLPVEVTYVAHVNVTRIDPEFFAPPQPGTATAVVRGDDYARALHFDRMERRLAVGLTRSGEPVYANLEFLDGTRGAHASISGVSGVATKTSYATFLLYSLFHSRAIGRQGVNTKAIVFNVKGEDLLWLDKANARLDETARAQYARIDLPVGPFASVALFSPARKGTQAILPDTGGRLQGVRPYVWTLKEFARNRLLRFAFAEGDDARAQLSFVIYRVERALEDSSREGDVTDPGIVLEGRSVRSFGDLVDLLDGDELESIVGGHVATGTLDAFRRRLHAAAEHIGHLVRGTAEAREKAIAWEAQQVTVVDIHTLHSTAQMFVVGSLLKRLMEEKEAKGRADPLLFVVLDELNKYAPRSGWSPIRDVLLDIAERGRSLGVSLFGAQQTASEVERRVVANASLRVVGRLDTAEAERDEYRWLGNVGRLRASILQPGTMIVSQPEIPVPILLRFPFPAWATRQSEVAEVGGGEDVFKRVGD